MNPLSTLKLALRALWRNKVRSLLTMLGIVFGIGAVIAMVAGGQGAQAAVQDVFQNLGTNVVIVMNGQQRSGVSGGQGSFATLTWDDLKSLESGEVPTIKWIAPTMSTRAQVVSDAGNTNTSIVGTRAVWFQIRNWKAEQGTLFDEDTGNSNAKVAVIGKTVAKALFEGQNPVGQSIRMNGSPYEVIGVLESKGQGPMGDSDDTVIVPLLTYQQKLDKGGPAKYFKGQLLISMNSMDDAERTIAGVTSILRYNHKLDSNDEDDFRIRNPTEFAKAQQDSTERVAILLKIVAGISLLVGGIGVMNIMLVSVIERTREIGIRMAVGAKPLDVMTQFLVEALALAMVGGLLGLAAGYGGAVLLARVFGWKMLFPAATAAIAFAVSGGVGVAFGLYPAWRASQLDPITALRYET